MERKVPEGDRQKTERAEVEPDSLLDEFDVVTSQMLLEFGTETATSRYDSGVVHWVSADQDTDVLIEGGMIYHTSPSEALFKKFRVRKRGPGLSTIHHTTTLVIQYPWEPGLPTAQVEEYDEENAGPMFGQEAWFRIGETEYRRPTDRDIAELSGFCVTMVDDLRRSRPGA